MPTLEQLERRLAKHEPPAVIHDATLVTAVEWQLLRTKFREATKDTLPPRAPIGGKTN